MNDVTSAALCPSGHTDGFARAHLPPPDTWPDFLFDLPELQYPERLNCASALLDGAIARGWGARTALIGARERLSYAELLAQVDRIAHVLRHDLGLATGSRVLLRGANCPKMAACILGVIKAGCIVLPTMPLLRARELRAIADKARINAVLCADGLVDEVNALGLEVPVLVFGAPAPDAPNAPDALEARMARHDAPFIAADTARDDVCLISFTSGTTGIPKGTMHFHRDVLAICDCFPRHMLDACAADIFIGTPPLAFTFGLGGLLLFPLRVGGAGVLLERLSPEALLAAIADYRATVCFTAPTFYRLMAAQADRFDLTSLRASVSAGEPLPLATRDAWQSATGLAMIDGIGATELLHIFIASAGAAIRPGATGKPVPGYQACILDVDGVPVGPGVIGRLAVKGPTGCRYLDDERQVDYVQGGWNITGDAYEMDADGYFYYRSRTDDMIISAGYNIAGAEVEEALLHHPAVAECAVVGRLDPERGQVVEAHVVLRAGRAGSHELACELQEFVKAQIAPYKYPRAILFKEKLPRTETGKLQRFKLRTNAD
ncbi:AMP-binding protein [Oxalobacteraceae sp. CFBP 8763]|nr:AMP-binding protein [Oxalobacteraceae sp. CFBP 8763]